MKRRILSMILSFVVATTAMPATALVVTQAADLNLALNKTATANASETSAFGAEKAVDGIIDRKSDGGTAASRWASDESLATADNPKWLQIDLGSEQTFSKFVIDWERKNPTNYEIQTSNDGTSWGTVYQATTAPTDYTETITLDAPVSARYVKLVIKEFNATAEGITWSTVSVFEFKVMQTEDDLKQTNQLLDGTATASDRESPNLFGAENVVDGVVNRSAVNKDQSRWASNVTSATVDAPKWVQVALEETKTFQSFIIEWERTNATSYKVQYSMDGTAWSDAYVATSQPTSEREIINLDAPIQAAYVRVLINSYLKNSPMPDGTTMEWNTVSIFEFEGYPNKTAIPVEPEETLDSVVSGLTVPAVEADDTQMQMPVVPEGFEIEFIGADYEQIIGDDLTIYKPLVDMEVEVNFRVKKDDTFKESAAITVVVPGLNTQTEDLNAKPNVIPDLTEWIGGTGEFTITDESRIMINPTYKDELTERMNTFAQDYKEITGKEITVVEGTQPQAGDFYITLGKTDAGLTKEGYLMTVGDFVKVEAEDAIGAFWSTRSILQILEQTETTIPQGTTRDYPRFEKRGFMLDVGRKFYTLDYVYQIMKNMSWYKMNDFQLHLNDNYIWIEEYVNEGKDPLKDAYSGFRIESDIEGLTNTDGAYTKDEFRSLIQNSRTYGVDIVPEFDVPAHCLAITKVRPDLAMTDTSIARAKDHLDLTNPDTIPFVQSLFDEYLDGENPVFDADTTVHIGTDEYASKYAEQFRSFTDTMLKYIRDTKNHQVRMWGGLTWIKGNTQVTSEDVEINIWSKDWAEPKQMYDAGYNLINILDASPSYIVPNGTGNLGAYADRLPIQQLYKNWVPNKMAGVTIPAGSDQMIGGAFAVWHDNIDRKETGLTSYDIFDAFNECFPIYAEKSWAQGKRDYTTFKSVAKNVNIAPNTNPKYKVETEDTVALDYTFDQNLTTDSSVNNYDAVSNKNVTSTTGKVGNGVALAGGESYIETPIGNAGTSSVLSFWAKKAAGTTGEQILFESDICQIKAAQKGTGKLGFSREGQDYSFNYSLPDETWVKIELKTYSKKTELYVNDTLVDTLAKAGTGTKYATLVLPLMRIGSETDAFKGILDEVSLTIEDKAVDDKSVIPHSKMTYTTTDEHPETGNEGPIAFAFDDDEGTHWHTNYTNKKDLPATVSVTLDKVYMVNKFSYLPRQVGGSNGNITEYELQVSKDGTSYTTVSSGSWEDSAELRVISFAAQEVKFIKFIAKAGVGTFASAAEFNVYQVLETVAVESITLNKDVVALEVGETENIKATVNPTNATDKTVTWSTDKASVATVVDGKITAVAEGTAKITATAGGKTATCTVTVTKTEVPNVPVESVTLSKKAVALKVGTTETITATVNPSNATDNSVAWSTDKASVATVVDGKITAVAEGIAKITATAGGKTATCTVTVTKTEVPNVPVESVTLDKTTVALKVGAIETVKATVNPSNATDNTVVWSTDKASVATVVDGKITAVAAGTAKITATAGGKTATCTVTVTKTDVTDVPVESVTLDKTEVALKAGETETVKATVNPENATDKTVTWSTDKASVATVNGGQIIAVAAGTAKITATAGGKTATCIVTVTKAEQHPTNGWYQDKTNNKWKYYKNNIALKSKWVQDYKVWYYIGQDEYMTTKWQFVGGKWYYLGTNGKMVTNWKQISKVWYYFNKSGAMLTKWQKIDNKWYYFNESGAMKTNWYKEGNTWYYLKANGAMVTGWNKIGGSWYFMNTSGKMQTKWVKSKGLWYFMNSSGKMATGWIKDGGKYYFLNATGAWTGKTK